MITTIATVALMGFGLSAGFAAKPADTPGKPAKVTVCHWDAEAEAYVVINVSERSAHLKKHVNDVAYDPEAPCEPVIVDDDAE